jgi:intracellular sulfur oxidation DsrE/DsrF family protein
VFILSVLILVISGVSLAVAEPITGPVIEEFGPVYYVPDQPLRLPPEETLKAVFDVASAPEATAESNYRLETAARFLNLNARAGVPAERMDVAIVLHGRATRAALNAEIFEERYGETHPDKALLDALVAAGVEVHVCGQSASAFGFAPQDLRPDVILSPSAMTALVRLQSAGYALIPWGAQ